MGLIRHLLGGGRTLEAAPNPSIEGIDSIDAAEAARPADPTVPLDPDAEERAYELDVLRAEQARLDELAQRQLKYERYSWEPPAQGGDRRADDADEAPERRSAVRQHARVDVDDPAFLGRPDERAAAVQAFVVARPATGGEATEGAR